MARRTNRYLYRELERLLEEARRHLAALTRQPS
jgi:hypothetical protein